VGEGSFNCHQEQGVGVSWGLFGDEVTGFVEGMYKNSFRWNQ
jgi:hypothetical protein